MPTYHPDHYRDSYATTDSVKPLKQTTGPEFYDRSNLSRMVGLMGVSAAALFGAVCIVGGFVISLSQYTISSGIVAIPISARLGEGALAACTEATGFVHGIALRSGLASEGRLRFNTNLRLLSASSGLFNPNGTTCNIVMAILLILSYSSSLLVFLSVDMESPGHGMDSELVVCISAVPLIVLGVALILQAAIALISVWFTVILTWSSSPFDITAALVHHTQISPELGQCMRGVGDRHRGPVAPSLTQPSAWRAHSSVRKVIMTLLVLALICIAWGIIALYISDHNILGSIKSWSFFPRPESHVIVYFIPLTWYWALYYFNMAAIQGPLTLGLHCSELVVNVIRDEKMWRKATTEKGATVSLQPLAAVFGSTPNVCLLVLKPLLHWMLGLAISLAGTAEDGLLTAIAVSMWPLQVLNYSVALLVFSLALTVIVVHRPKGPQPAAYGHVQTLANLIDEWSPTMWWGRKDGKYRYRHAGTSDCPLPKVDMDALYA
ncbi:hypothetical protein HD554DRAFT_2234553 [Boletus coccyginus]|nr:hypothetical protein HD554DRAFT_2234553 [Boletus coccyginus]